MLDSRFKNVLVCWWWNMANYEKLNIRQNAVELSVDVYKFMDNNENIQKDFALKDQIQRASLSIASNIAEGADRGTQKEFNRFLYIARGSCSELRTQMIIIKKLWYISESDFVLFDKKIVDLHKMINGMIQRVWKNVKDK